MNKKLFTFLFLAAITVTGCTTEFGSGTIRSVSFTTPTSTDAVGNPLTSTVTLRNKDNLYIDGNTTSTGAVSATTLEVNDDYITDFTGTNLSVTAGVLNASGGGGGASALGDLSDVATTTATVGHVLALQADGTYDSVAQSGGGGVNDWQVIWPGTLAPTSTNDLTGLFVNASSTIAANLRVDGDLSIGSGGQIIADNGTEGAPSIAFDGATGIYQNQNDTIGFALNNAGLAWQITGSWIQPDTTILGPGLARRTPTAILPTVVPKRQDQDTGLGHSGTEGIMTLIGNGVEVLRIDGDNASSTITGDFNVTANSTTTGSAYIGTTAGLNTVYIDNWTDAGDYTARGTGLITGGILSLGSGTPDATFSISDGNGVIADHTTDPAVPTYTAVSWTGKTDITVTNIATNIITFVGINSSGTVLQQTSPFTNTQRRDIIVLGVVVHVNTTTVNTLNQEQFVAINPIQQLYDLSEAIGFFNVTGNVFSIGTSGGLYIAKNGGDIYAVGSNYSNDPKNPSTLTLSAEDNIGFQYRDLDGDNRDGNPTAELVIDPDIYDNAGTLSAMPVNKWSVQRIYVFLSAAVKIQPGQATYNSLEVAEAAITSEAFITEPSILANGLLRGFLVVQQGETDLNNAKFVAAEKFGSTSGAGTAVTDHGTLSGLGDDDHTQYQTDARALTWLGTRSTTDLPEGTNLYYTQARFDTAYNATTTLNGFTPHDAVTLAGTPNYLTLASQAITMTVLDINDDTDLTVSSPLSLSAGGDISWSATGFGENDWQFSGTTAITPTTSVGLLVNASSTFTGDLTAGGGTLFVDQSLGTVGIGDLTPDGKLEVRQTAAADIFNLYDNTTNVLTVQDGGFVGLGTSAPDGRLHVFQATAGVVTPNANGDDLVVENSTHGGISILTPDATNGSIFFGSPTDSLGAQMTWNHDADRFIMTTRNAGASVVFRTADNVTAMTIDSSQRVGIGDETPTHLLSVGNGDLFTVDGSGNSTSTATTTAQGFKGLNLISCDTIDTDAEGQFVCGTDGGGGGGALGDLSDVATTTATVGHILKLQADGTFDLVVDATGGGGTNDWKVTSTDTIGGALFNPPMLTPTSTNDTTGLYIVDDVFIGANATVTGSFSIGGKTFTALGAEFDTTTIEADTLKLDLSQFTTNDLPEHASFLYSTDANVWNSITASTTLQIYQDYIWDISANTNLAVSGSLQVLTDDTLSVKAGTLTDTKGCIYTTASGFVCNSDWLALTGGEQTVTEGPITFSVYPEGPGTTPTSSAQLIDKAYADALASGFLYKEQVRLASAANVTATSTLATVDGVVTVAGDRVLLKDQTAPINDGCWIVVDGGDWTLCTDSDTDAEVDPGTAYFVTAGDTNIQTGWAVLSAETNIPGTDVIVYGQISGATSNTWGDGLINTSGVIIDLDLTANTPLVITTNKLDFNAGYGLEYDDLFALRVNTSTALWQFNSASTTDTLSVGGYATSTGGLFTQGVLHVGSTADFDGVITANSNLLVTGTSIFTGTATSTATHVFGADGAGDGIIRFEDNNVLTFQLGNDDSTNLFTIDGSGAFGTSPLLTIDSSGNASTTGKFVIGADGTGIRACYAALDSTGQFTYWYFPTAGSAPTYSATTCEDTGSNSTTTFVVGQL